MWKRGGGGAKDCKKHGFLRYFFFLYFSDYGPLSLIEKLHQSPISPASYQKLILILQKCYILFKCKFIGVMTFFLLKKDVKFASLEYLIPYCKQLILYVQ